jgi:hypothetical protein
LGEGRLDEQKAKDAIGMFRKLIEKNKDRQPYSDYKEGINHGLEIAKDAFEENAEKFVYSNSSNSNEDMDAKIKSLQDRFEMLLGTIVVEKPRYTRGHLEGIDRGFEKSKILFAEFIKDFV